MQVFHASYATLTLESSLHEHAIRVTWHQNFSTAWYQNVMACIMHLFQEHTVFSAIVLDLTSIQSIPRQSLAWTKDHVIPKLKGQLSQVYLQVRREQSGSPLCLQISDTYEPAGILVSTMYEHQSLEQASIML